MAIVKSTSDKFLSLNVQHDYITLRTPNGNFTTSFRGSKASGALAKDDVAFNKIDKFVQTKSKTMSYGDVMSLLLDTKTLTKLWKGWNTEIKKNEFKDGDVVKFTSPIFIKKYSGKFTVVKVAKKYVYIKVTDKNGRVSNVGFDYTELVNV